jgi:PAS domain S-box-containing protein
MNQILFISPSEQGANKARDIIFRHHMKVDVWVGSWENARNYAEQAIKQGVKVIISRGGTADLLRHSLDTAIIKVRFTSAAYLEAFERLRSVEGKIAFFVLDTMPSFISHFCKLLNIDACYYSYTGDKDVEKAVKKAKTDGCHFGVGGVLAKNYARLYDFSYYTLENTEDEIELALDSAQQTLSSIIQEEKHHRELQLKLEQYEAVLNYTHDGILAINKEGNIVVVNKQAEEILPLKNKPYEGKYIEEVFPSSKLSSVLRTGEKEMDELMKTGNVVINTNRIPIMVNGKIEGVVATFKDVDSIRNSEQKIRTNLHKRGMVARYRFSDIVGESKVMKRAIYMAKSFAKYDANILIQGEIGTGKEMFAHAIHHESQRRNHPFLAVNCSNISADRLTRQLLGREKEGELFGSPESQEGAFELAHGGTLFLDKIDEAPLEAQSDILRILEDNEVCRINGRHTISVDVRIIASAGNGLQKKMQIGDFLEELYYKISVLSLEIPPLRNREADYLLLSENLFHRYFGSEYYMYESKIRKIEEYMQNYIWKGNIRELQNFVQRVSVLMKNAMPVDEIMLTMPENSMMNDTSIDVKMNKWSRAHIVDALTASKLNITKAARMLGCSRGTLYKKMNELNIKISNIE